MELRHLRYFVAAAEELNISHAAVKVNVSQPAMSRLIRDLEDQLGTRLFIRERFGLALTPAGERFQKYARQILDLCTEAALSVQEAQRTEALNVGFIATALVSFLADALREFREQSPHVVVNIHEMTPADQIVALRKGALDLALLGNPCEEIAREFRVEVLRLLQLQAVLPKQHPAAGRETIGLIELQGDDFVGYTESSFPGRNDTIIKACQRAGFTPMLKYRAGSLVEVLGMVGTGMGVCLMPADVATLPHPNAAFVPLQDAVEPIKWSAAWHLDDHRESVQRLLQALRS